MSTSTSAYIAILPFDDAFFRTLPGETHVPLLRLINRRKARQGRVPLGYGDVVFSGQIAVALNTWEPAAILAMYPYPTLSQVERGLSDLERSAFDLLYFPAGKTWLSHEPIPGLEKASVTRPSFDKEAFRPLLGPTLVRAEELRTLWRSHWNELLPAAQERAALPPAPLGFEIRILPPRQETS